MRTKTIGVAIIIIGVLMIIYTRFNFVTTEKVVDFGPIEMSVEENHPVQWSPTIGVILLVGGVVLVALNRKNISN